MEIVPDRPEGGSVPRRLLPPWERRRRLCQAYYNELTRNYPEFRAAVHDLFRDLESIKPSSPTPRLPNPFTNDTIP